MSATLRYRGDKSNLIELAKNLDAFKKVPEKYTESSTTIGGTLSLISRLLIIYLIYKEFQYYQDAKLKYEFIPDIDSETVPMTVDITIAMPCASLSGVDLNDDTQQDVFAYGTLQRKGVWWKLSPKERMQFEGQQHYNHFLREQYHSVVDLLFKDIIKSNDKPAENEGEEQAIAHTEEDYDACRLFGTLVINKVAGVMHLVGGATPVLDIFGDHIMIGIRRLPANFTHRINKLSFGQYSKRLVQPLEGDETYVSDEDTTVQYLLSIVPTEIHNSFSTISTYQYSVAENIRVLDSSASYGSPGIYFKYDWSALKIIVRTDRDSLVKFTVRLCSMISGIIVISAILNNFLLFCRKSFIRKFAPQLLDYHLKRSPSESSLAKSFSSFSATTPPMSPQASHSVLLTNDLITNANKMSALVAPIIPTTTNSSNTFSKNSM